MKNWKLSNGSIIYLILGGRINVYLISTPKGNILVDTGMERNREKIIENLKKLDLPVTTIDYVILTHTHFDHCKNASFFQKEMNCRIICSEKDKDFTSDGYTIIPEGTNVFTKFLSWAGKKIGKRWFGYDLFIADIEVNDYLSLKEKGFDIDIISTPGHSKGSISIIVNNEVALVGDTMFGIFRNSIFPPFADDVQGLYKSWQKLLETNCKLFLPGHGSEIKRELVDIEIKKLS